MSILKYEMKLSLNVLNHLGINLYSNIPSVMSEIIANSWDADASRVDIRVIKGRNGEPQQIAITDDGTGMDLSDINKKFLLVGYNRRTSGDSKDGCTPKGRRPMGRKGIGKLSLFSIADSISVHSKKGNSENAFLMDADKIREKVGSGESSVYNPDEIKFDGRGIGERGTRIILNQLKKKITVATFSAMRKQVARRFSLSCFKEMQVFVNGEEITIKDRDYLSKLEYIFDYGGNEHIVKMLKLAKDGRQQRLARLDETGGGNDEGKYQISGWIGLVPHSPDLGGKEKDNINKISIMVRDKLAVEDVLEGFGFNSIFTKFLIGEIQANFLDEDDKEDIATSSRQKVIEDDPRYEALMAFLRKELKEVRNFRDNHKGDSGLEEAKKHIPGIKAWIDEMNSDAKKKARNFFGNINKLDIDGKDKGVFFKHGAQAFQSYRLKGSLNELEKISIENMESFLSVTAEIDSLEASYYYLITKERLGIIQKFENMADENAMEKVLQKYLFEHLWLLDPSWDRATVPVMERRVSEEFRKIDEKLSPQERAAMGRVDIKYRTVNGINVIVELKRPSVRIHDADIQRQVEKYYDALNRCLVSERIERNYADYVEVVCVTGKLPIGWDDASKRSAGIESLKAKNIKLLTYDTLISNAKNSYSKYLEEDRKMGEFYKMIRDLDETDSEE